MQIGAIQTDRSINALRRDEISRDYEPVRSLNESSTGSQHLKGHSEGAFRFVRHEILCGVES